MQRIAELVGESGSVVSVNDKALVAPLRVKLLYKEAAIANGAS